MTPSKYQTAIYNWVKNGKGNCIVSAAAGAAKSTSALESVRLMKGDVLMLAFNSKINQELKTKVSQMFLPNVECQTFHACGKSVLLKSKGYHKVDASKVYFITEKHCQTQELQAARPFIQKLVSFAKNYAIGVKNGGKDINDVSAWMEIVKTQDCSLDADISIEMAIEISIEILKESNRDFKVIDFDDMIYLPLIYDCNFKKYAFLVVDEAQDTNIARKLILKKLCGNDTRLLIVGDSEQAIYGFTGAESDSMNILKDMFNCIELPLSICYRCDKNIIVEAQKYVPTIEFWEGNGEGIVREEKYVDFCTNVATYNLTKKDGILCRNNAPLVAMAFSLIRNGIGCRIEGKDFAKGLLNICNKWKVTNLNVFMEKLVKYFDKEFEKASKAKMVVLEDKLETFVILIERCQSLGKHDVSSLKNLIESMFSDKDDNNVPNCVVLSSIHKSKGLEFDRVFCLGNGQFIPSKYAVTEEQLAQENNLLYIATTRAKHELCLVTDCPTRNNKEQEPSPE